MAPVNGLARMRFPNEWKTLRQERGSRVCEIVVFKRRKFIYDGIGRGWGLPKAQRPNVDKNVDNGLLFRAQQVRTAGKLQPSGA
jgi:hypothetical protein